MRRSAQTCWWWQPVAAVAVAVPQTPAGARRRGDGVGWRWWQRRDKNGRTSGAGGGGATGSAGGSGAPGATTTSATTALGGQAGGFLQGGTGGTARARTRPGTQGATAQEVEWQRRRRRGGGYYGGGGGGGADDEMSAGGGGGPAPDFVGNGATRWSWRPAPPQRPTSASSSGDSPPAFTSSGPFYGTVGKPFLRTITATGVPAPTFVVTGSWPAVRVIDNRADPDLHRVTGHILGGQVHSGGHGPEHREGTSIRQGDRPISSGRPPQVSSITGTVAYATVGKAGTVTIDTQAGYPSPPSPRPPSCPRAWPLPQRATATPPSSGTPATGSRWDLPGHHDRHQHKRRGSRAHRHATRFTLRGLSPSR